MILEQRGFKLNAQFQNMKDKLKEIKNNPYYDNGEDIAIHPAIAFSITLIAIPFSSLCFFIFLKT